MTIRFRAASGGTINETRRRGRRLTFFPKQLLAILMILTAAPPGRAFDMEDARLAVAVDPATASFSVLDKKTGATWRQAVLGDRYKVAASLVTSSGLELQLDGAFPLTVNLTLLPDRPDLRVRITAPSGGAMAGPLAYPYPFVIEASRGHLVLPIHEGMILPVTDMTFVDDPLEGKFGPQDAVRLDGWFGLTDLKAGCAALCETPYDAELRATRAETDGGKVCVFQWIWQPGKGRLGYTRSVLYHFASDGGYVALAKFRRQWLIERGEFVTLKQKAVRAPRLAQLAGAPDVWIWLDARSLDFLRSLKAAGIGRALVQDHPYEPSAPMGMEFSKRAADVGYLLGIYDNFDNPSKRASVQCPDGWRDRAEADAVVQADGKRIGWCCSARILERAKVEMARSLASMQYTSRFCDTLVQPLKECYSPDHPATREQDAQRRAALARYLADDLGQVVGCENPASYVMPVIHFCEGGMSLEHFRDKSMATRRADRDVEPQHQALFLMAPVTPSERFIRYTLAPGYRVPLLELVYHDSVMNTWHWRDSNMRMTGFWDMKNQWNILYGTLPLWNLSKTFFAAHREWVVKSYRDVCEWQSKIAWDEMVDHRWLTSDRAVQESRFSSGWAAIVNFGATPYRGAQGRAVAPGGFTTYRWRSKTR